MVFSQGLIGARHDLPRIVRVPTKYQHRAWLGVAVPGERDNHAVANLRLMPEGSFEVFRIDVHALGCHYHVLLPPLEIKVAVLVELTHIARVKPPFLAQSRFQFSSLPVACCNALTAHQDLAAFVQPHFTSRQHLANGSPPQPKRMIHADH